MASQVGPRASRLQRVGALLGWPVLIVAAVAGAVLFAGAASWLLHGAGNVALGGPAYFRGAAFYVAVPASQVGALAALALATACYRRSAWSVLRNGTVAVWVFAVFDAMLANPYSGVAGLAVGGLLCGAPLAMWLASRTRK